MAQDPQHAPEMLRQMANAIRALSMDAVQAANSGHPGMPMGMADAATVLWTQFLKHDPKAPRWHDRDRFVLSAGHGSMLLYSLLYLSGYEDISLDDLKNFRQLDAPTAGHPEYGHLAGIETTTGPLGQGFANAVGMAMAERNLRAEYGADTVDHYTYAIAGDGCLMEGISHEAASMAGHQQLGRLIVLFDDNGISIDGPTSMSVSEDTTQRFLAYGWHVESVDGHDMGAVAHAHQDRPDLEPVALHLEDVANPRCGVGIGEDEAVGRPGEPRMGEDAFAQRRIKGRVDMHLALVGEIAGLIVEDRQCRAHPAARVAVEVAELRM